MIEENPIKKFVDELVEEAEIMLPEAEMIAYKDKLMDQVNRRLGVVSLNYLDKEGLAEYEKLLDKNASLEELINFFPAHIENYQEKITQALDDFAREYFAAL
ncbi:MAG: hypothetical protein BWY03_00426 [Parcubacteria group bacterium ADurb.Bin159]|jgi:glutamine phosphoribosylpyrophosphate amidotransferase|nr:MAG: hypothetical protein BWY03_00426 [Parcubacteria group bacterium ADurb.Bin159]